MDGEFVELTMLDGTCRKLYLPVAIALWHTLHGVVLVFLPIVEVADDIDFRGIGCPLTKNPFLVLEMESIVEITRGEIGQLLLAALREFINLVEGVLMTTFDGCGEWS